MAEKKVDLSKMNRKERWDYIWYYYKNHMIFGGLGLILAISLIYDVITNDEIIFNLTLCGQAELLPEYTELEDELTQLIAPDAKSNETVRLQLYALEHVEESFNELTALYQQKLLTQVTASELDLLIINQADFDFFYEQGMFEPLGAYTDINWDQISSEQLVKLSNKQEVYGIHVEGNQILESLNYPTQDKVMVMVKNSIHKDEAVQVINYLLSP